MNFQRLRSAILMFAFFLMGSGAIAAEALPNIDARHFEVKPIQKSSSGRIYLFESNVIPKTGNLVLLYDQDRPAMAFRVLKNDPAHKHFVGKRVRRYDQTGELKISEPYLSVEKIADVLPSPPGESPAAPALTAPVNEAPIQNNSDLDTTPTTPAAPAPIESHDDELDSGTVSTAKMNEIEGKKNDDLDQFEDTEDPEEEDPVEVDESARMEPFRNIISAGAGYYRNASNFSSTGTLQNGFGLSYAHVLIEDLFILKKMPQDSLGLELGFMYYRLINQNLTNDIFSVVPFYAQGLYQLHLSNSFTLNFYGGIQYNWVSAADNATQSILDKVQGFQPTFGAGFFYHIGPQWYFRADIGWDRITGGLSVKW